MLIYVSAPFSKGDQFVNIRTACLAGDEILKRGHYPVIPHLTATWHLISPKKHSEWLAIDAQIIPRCDALLRLPGRSEGADKEVEIAEYFGLKVYHSLEEIE